MGFSATTPDADRLGPRDIVDFATLVRAIVVADAERDTDRAYEARMVLWRSVLDMPTWLLVATEVDDRMRPHIRHGEGRASVLAFTDEFAALRHQAEHGLSFRKGFCAIEVKSDAAMDMMDGLVADGADDILFNDGCDAFSVPLSMLRRLRRHVVEGNDPEALDAASIQPAKESHAIAPALTAASRDPALRGAALDALLGLADWWFLCNPQQPDAFHVRRFSVDTGAGAAVRQAVVAFSEHRLALEATDRYGLADSDGSIVLMQMPVADAVDWLQSFREQDVETVMFDPLTTPFAATIADLPDAWTGRSRGS